MAFRDGPLFELVESKLHPPWIPPGMVARIALVERLLAAPEAWIICVVGPPGYGKTTLLTQWAKRTGRRVAWVTIDRGDNDPVVLLTYLAVALDRTEPIDPRGLGALGAPGAVVTGTAVARLTAAAAAMSQPVVLVVDQMELLDNLQCVDALAELAMRLPEGSQLALSGRIRPRLPVALLRAKGRVVELGVEELTMDRQEARALLAGAGVRLGEAATTKLIRQTEGWPVGLYLAARALQGGDPQEPGGVGFSGNDRLVADYLQSELLSRLPASQVSFLTRTAVLDRLSGPLCDAVLDTTGSAEVLASLERLNLLLVPLDQRRRWYRYHQLFGEWLRAELGRREPELVPQLHLRAAVWCEANGMVEAALHHAQAAGDSDRVARLVTGQARATYAGGRVATVGRWFAWFDEHGLVDRYPLVAVQGALLHLLVGHPAAAERWADAAERAWVGTQQQSGTVAAFLAMLRAFMCRNGVEQMRIDAQAALAGLAPGSSWQAPVLCLEGIAWLLAGQPDRADPILMQVVEAATDIGALPGASLALAERCILALERQDWPQAELLAGEALAIVRAGQLDDDYASSSLVYAVAARTASHRGNLPQAHQHLTRAARLRPMLTYTIPWLAVQAPLELARAYLVLEDLAGARVVLSEALEVLRRRPNLGVLPTQAAELRSRLDTSRGEAVGASSLTRAELRVLPFLPTHLSYREIGQRLHLSHNTVKKHAMTIHRKLDVTSRSQAVQRAQQLGLLVAPHLE